MKTIYYMHVQIVGCSYVDYAGQESIKTTSNYNKRSFHFSQIVVSSIHMRGGLFGEHILNRTQENIDQYKSVFIFGMSHVAP